MMSASTRTEEGYELIKREEIEGEEIGEKGVTPKFLSSSSHFMAMPKNKMRFI